MRTGSRWQELQKTADVLLARHAPGNWNQAMMELGATICTPRSPQCLLCPVAEFCKARKQGLTDAIPEKRNKRETVEIVLAALVLVDPEGRTLLLPPPKSKLNSVTTRDVAALLSRMWHFPTIHVKSDAAKELEIYVRKSIFAGAKLPAKLQSMRKARHAVTYRQITLFPMRLEVSCLPRIAGAKMLPLDNLSSVPVSNLTRKAARAALVRETGSLETNKASAATLQF
jgi:A/G-specific adenine glycosylase